MKCIVCEQQNHLNIKDILKECKVCGLVSAKTIPSRKELNRYYEKDYFFGQEYFDYIADRSALEANFSKRLAFLSEYINPSSRIIEVGCAYGYFLNMVKDDVKWHKGYDVSDDGIRYAKKKLKLNATTQDFLNEKEVKEGSVDAVFMWDVMEHFDKPDKYIEKAAAVLKKNGILSLTTGDVSSFVARRRGVSWRMVHPPTHLYYFSPKTMELLLNKHDLKTINVRHTATNRNIGSMFNQLIINRKAKNKNPRLFEIGLLISDVLRISRINLPLNLYDVMEVTAIKQ